MSELKNISPLNSLRKYTDGGGVFSVALDQWRGLAILIVLFSHGFFFTNRVNGFGRVGVNLFFFISGILVFQSLSREYGKTGWMIIREYWQKRLFRLYPALIAYLIILLPIVFILTPSPGMPYADGRYYLRGLPFAFLFAQNYVLHQPAMLVHLWFISCQMQFFLLAPGIYLLGGKNHMRKEIVWGAITLIFIISGIAGTCLDRDGINVLHFEVAAWPMMLGFYIEFKKKQINAILRKLRLLVKWIIPVVIVIVIVMMVSGYDMKKQMVVALGLFVTILPCFWMHAAGTCIGGLIGKALTWMGKRTYSIYLWQAPFAYLPELFHPVGAVLSVPLGWGMFRLFEKPFLSVGRRL